jgi:hypothetical protein
MMIFFSHQKNSNTSKPALIVYVDGKTALENRADFPRKKTEAKKVVPRIGLDNILDCVTGSDPSVILRPSLQGGPNTHTFRSLRQRHRA